MSEDRLSLPLVVFVVAVEELLELFCGEEVVALVDTEAELVARALVVVGVLLEARSSSDVSAFGPVSDQSPLNRNRLNEHEGCFSFLSGMMSVSKDELIVFLTS